MTDNTDNTATTNKATAKTPWWRELLLLGVAAAVGLLVGKVFLAGPGEGAPPVGLPERGDGSQAVAVEPLTGRPAGPESVAPGHTAGIGKTGTPPEGAAVFPDGTWLEPLNGVDKAPEFPGFPGGLFRPVLRIVTNAETGLQWYIHEGDLVSTTQMVTHQAGDEKWTSPEWVVGRPVPTQPVR